MPTCPHCGAESPQEGDYCDRCARGLAGGVEEAPAPWTRVTILLMSACLVVFLAMLLGGVPLMSPKSDQLIRWGADFGPLTFGGEWWRVFTNLFVHVGLLHLAFNMWALYTLGALAEQLFSRRSFLFIYLASGVAGSLASLWWKPVAVSAGASGAIFGLAGALIAVLYLGRLPVATEALKSTQSSLLSFAGYNLFFGAVSPAIDNAAHIGGLVAGLVMGGLVGRLVVASRMPRVAVRRGIFAVVAVVLVALGAYVFRVNGFIVHAHRATEASRAGKHDVAVREWEQVVRQRPELAEAWFYLAQSQLQMDKRPGPAIAALRKVLELEPEHDIAQAELAQLLAQTGELGEARALLEKARNRHPQSAELRVQLAQVLSLAGDQEAAITELREAVRLAPNYLNGRLLLGNALLQQNNVDEALVEIEFVLKAQPENPAALGVAAAAYARKGDQEKSLEMRQRLTEILNKAQEKQHSEAPAPETPKP